MVDISAYTVRRDDPRQGLTTLQLMKLARRWLVWRYGPITMPGKKPPKNPFYLSGGPREKTDTPEDLAQLATFEQAHRAVKESGGTLHLGFALGSDGMGGAWQGFDHDADPTASEVGNMPGYIERSVSGGGWHCISYGRPFAARVDHERGHEWYSLGRYFGVTLDEIRDGEPADLYDRAGSGPPADQAALLARPMEALEEAQLRDLRHALTYLDPSPYHTWVSVALALQKVEGGEDLFLEWARRSPKFDEAENRRKFANTGLPYAPWRSVFAWAKAAGWDPRERQGMDLLATAIPVDFGRGQPVEFVLDGFVATGMVVVAGSAGVGKSSILVALTLVVAHLAEVEGLARPYLRRRVYFVTEDVHQCQRIIRGMKLAGQIGAAHSEFDRWFKLIPAKRAEAAVWRKTLLDLMRADEAEGYRQEADGYSPTPLVVLDTVPATVALSDENANSEVSAAVAALRAGIGDASLWATMHVAKALKFSEGEDLSARGAGAWAADTTGEIFVALPPKQDPDDPPPTTRFVSLGKRRFEPTTSLYEVHTQVSEEAIDTPWGQRQTALYRTVSLMQAVTPEERREQRQRARSARQEDDLRARMMVMMTRAKRALESCEGEGLAVARTAGRAQPPPGYARWSLEDVMMGKRSSEVRGELVAALVEAYRPAEEEHFYLFKKPTFGMGKK